MNVGADARFDDAPDRHDDDADGLGAAAGPHVLLVEDNPDDVLLMRRAFRRAGVPVQLAVAEHGDAAVERLAAGGGPALVLLDWKLARRSGLEVLRWIRDEPARDTLPVVVLTSSREDEDVREAYGAGANSVLHKPHGFDRLQALVTLVAAYWLQANVTPPTGTA